ncbi:MAG: rod shape-determining protein MreD [Phycisphaerae bacterium]
MHWVAFGILLYVVTVLQTALAPHLAIHAARPNMMVIVAAYYALTARTHDALLACWIIGLVIDLTSLSYHDHGNVGLSALTLGCIAMLIVRAREFAVRDSVLTHLIFTAAATMALSTAVGSHMLWIRGDWTRFSDVLALSFYTAIYTGVLAPYAHWILRRTRNLLGIGPTHRLRVR